KGVDLREPLNPAAPDVAQASALPWRSVIVTMVLLKEAWMWAMPSATFFLTFLRTRVGAAGAFAMCVFPECLCYFVAPPLRWIALRGPLRVRALVRVRWPRSGSPRRCRVPR